MKNILPLLFLFISLYDPLSAQDVRLLQDVLVTVQRGSEEITMYLHKNEIFELNEQNQVNIALDAITQDTLPPSQYKKLDESEDVDKSFLADLDNYVNLSSDKEQYIIDVSDILEDVTFFYGSIKNDSIPIKTHKKTTFKANSRPYIRLHIPNTPSIVYWRDKISKTKEEEQLTTNKPPAQIIAPFNTSNLMDSLQTIKQLILSHQKKSDKNLSEEGRIVALTIFGAFLLGWMLFFWLFKNLSNKIQLLHKTVEDGLSKIEDEIIGNNHDLPENDMDSGSEEEVPENLSTNSDSKEEGLSNQVELKSIYLPSKKVEAKHLSQYLAHLDDAHQLALGFIKDQIDANINAASTQALMAILSKFQTSSINVQESRWKNIFHLLSTQSALIDEELIQQVGPTLGEEQRWKIIQDQSYKNYLRKKINQTLIFLEDLRNLSFFITNKNARDVKVCKEAHNVFSESIQHLITGATQLLKIKINYVPICEPKDNYSHNLVALDQMKIHPLYDPVCHRFKEGKELMIIEIAEYATDRDQGKTLVKVLK